MTLRLETMTDRGLARFAANILPNCDVLNKSTHKSAVKASQNFSFKVCIDIFYTCTIFVFFIFNIFQISL